MMGVDTEEERTESPKNRTIVRIALALLLCFVLVFSLCLTPEGRIVCCQIGLNYGPESYRSDIRDYLLTQREQVFHVVFRWSLKTNERPRVEEARGIAKFALNQPSFAKEIVRVRQTKLGQDYEHWDLIAKAIAEMPKKFIRRDKGQLKLYSWIVHYPKTAKGALSNISELTLNFQHPDLGPKFVEAIVEALTDRRLKDKGAILVRLVFRGYYGLPESFTDNYEMCLNSLSSESERRLFELWMIQNQIAIELKVLNSVAAKKSLKHWQEMSKLPVPMNDDVTTHKRQLQYIQSIIRCIATGKDDSGMIPKNHVIWLSK